MHYSAAIVAWHDTLTRSEMRVWGLMPMIGALGALLTTNAYADAIGPPPPTICTSDEECQQGARCAERPLCIGQMSHGSGTYDTWFGDFCDAGACEYGANCETERYCLSEEDIEASASPDSGSGDESGCGCRLPAMGHSGTWAALLVALGALAWGLRRKPR